MSNKYLFNPGILICEHACAAGYLKTRSKCVILAL